MEGRRKEAKGEDAPDEQHNLNFQIEPEHSMDSFLKYCERELLQSTMLKHEKIFKDQLQELHRLYRIQKFLMDELRIKGLEMNSHINADSSTMSDAAATQENNAGTSETSHSSHISTNPRMKELSIVIKEPRRIQSGIEVLEEPAEEFKLTNARAAMNDYILPGTHLKGEKSIEGQHNWPVDEDTQLRLSIGCGAQKI